MSKEEEPLPVDIKTEPHNSDNCSKSTASSSFKFNETNIKEEKVDCSTEVSREIKLIERNLVLYNETSFNIKREVIDIKEETSSADTNTSVAFIKLDEENADSSCYKTCGKNASKLYDSATNAKIQCTNCDYKTAVENDLINHMKIHSKLHVFVCEQCEFKTHWELNLIKHMRIHTGEKPFVCNLCSYKASIKSNLKSHIIAIHTGEKPFQCNLCDFKSSRKYHLIIHMRVHTGEKPFVCNLCNFKTSQKCNLKAHMTVHTGEKSFTCNLCGFKTSMKSSLLRHQKSLHKSSAFKL